MKHLTAALVIVLSATITQPAVAAIPMKPSVTTIAGSGRAGIADGPALQAQFIEPMGLAYGPDGTLYVVDRAAERIRAISPTGLVRTIAGSAPILLGSLGAAGGYADGPGATARFDQPIGIAVDSDGTIYVGDTKNHCIRAIRDGVVSTFAGAPSRPGSADGPIAVASFSDPRAIAVDAAHDVFVGDYPNGLRKISHDGIVSTVKTPDPITGITIGRFSPKVVKTTDEVLITSSVTSIAVWDTASMTNLRAWSLTTDFVSDTWSAEGGVRLGPAASIAAVDAYSVVYTDLLYRTVRWYALPAEIPFAGVLGHEPGENDAMFGGEFRDGSGNVASFVAPAAVARAPDGSIVVADAGAKRIRRVSAFDRRNQETAILQGEVPVADATLYQIAVVGGANVNTGVPWSDSLVGEIERSLVGAPGLGARSPRVGAIRRQSATWENLSAAVAEATQSAADVVVFDYPGEAISDEEAGIMAAGAASAASRVREMRRLVEARGKTFYVLFHPGASQWPGEMEYRTMPRSTSDRDNALLNDASVMDAASTQKLYETVITVLRASGVSIIDAWPDMLAYKKKPHAMPLFGAWDQHLTPAGNHIIGDVIARRLLAEHPWTTKKH